MRWSLLFLLIIATNCDPNLKIRLNKPGFDFLKHAGHHVVDEEIPKIRIPTITIPIHEGPGSGSVTAKEMKVKKFKTPVFDFALSSTGISWRSHDGAVKIKGHWKAEYTWGLAISESGWVQAIVSDIRIALSANVSTLDGRPQIEILHCDAEIEHLDIEIGGGVIPWLVNLFRSPLSVAIKNAIHQQACATASSILLEQANDYLHNLPLSIPIGHNFYVHYKINENPTFTSTFVESSFLADVVYGSETCALPVKPMGNDAGSDPLMTTIWVSSQLGNCLLNSAHDGGILEYTITKDIPQIAGYLRTSCPFISVCIGKFFSKLKKDFPDQYVDLHFHSAKSPKLTFEKDLASLNTTSAVDLYIHPRTNTSEILARLEVTSRSSVLPYVDGNRVVGVLNGTDVEVKEVFSNIGDVSSGFLKMFEKIFLLSANVMGNVILKKGLPFPVFDNVTIANTSTVNIFDGFVRVNADFEYLNASIDSRWL